MKLVPRSFLLVLLAVAGATAQSARFPSAIATDNDLTVAVNRAQTTLTNSINSSATSFQVSSCSPFTSNNILVTIDSEILKTCSCSGTTLNVGYSACPNVDGRGYDNTIAASHTAGATVAANIDAFPFNALRKEVEAIESTAGVNFSNIASLPGGGLPMQYLQVKPNNGATVAYQWANKPQRISTDYIFPTQSPSGSLSAGNNTITISPVPLGVNWNDPGNRHKLWVAGTGTPEACYIVTAGPGTATSGSVSGTLTIHCAGSHSAGYTVGDAYFGIEEAIMDATAGGTSSPPDVVVPNTTPGPTLYDTLYFPPTKDFTFQGGTSVWLFDASNTGDAFFIDSCEDCHYYLPLILYRGNQNSLHIAPTLTDPGGLIALVDSQVFIQSINQDNNTGTSNAHMLLDSTNGVIANNEITLFEAYDNSVINGGYGINYGILCTGGNQIGANWIKSQDLNGPKVAVVKDSAASQRNLWQIFSATPSNVSGNIGVDINGARSQWFIGVSNAPSGLGMVVESTAIANGIHPIYLDGGYTNNSTHFNRLYLDDYFVSTGRPVGYSVTTPAVPASASAVKNTNLTPVVISFPTAGTSGFVYTEDVFGAGPSTGIAITTNTQVYLGVGESAYLVYSAAPTWQWRGLP